MLALLPSHPHGNIMEDNIDTVFKLVRGKRSWLVLDALITAYLLSIPLWKNLFVNIASLYHNSQSLMLLL